jgi:hypothetical protein
MYHLSPQILHQVVESATGASLSEQDKKITVCGILIREGIDVDIAVSFCVWWNLPLPQHD